MIDVPDILMIGGIACIIAGIALVSIAAALIALGLALVVIAYLIEIKKHGSNRATSRTPGVPGKS